MFFWQKKNNRTTQDIETVTFMLDGMHCVSCSLNIDGALEDTPGVESAETSYAKGKTTIKYNKDEVTPKALKAVIEGLGYHIKEGTTSS